MQPPLLYRMHFHGRTRTVAAGVVERVETEAIGGAELFSEAVFTDGCAFRERGTIHFGNGDLVELRTLGTGHLSNSSDPSLRHGTVVWDIDGGSGRFSGATGRISSNFTVTRDGDVDDEHVGRIFLPPNPTTKPRRRDPR